MHQQIAGMRIGVEEAIFQQLLQISANQQAVNFDCRNAARAQPFDVGDLRATNELERQHATARVRPVDLRHSNHAPGAEVVAEAIGIPSFLHVVHLFKDGGVKLAQHSFPVGVFICSRKEAIGELHDAIKNRDVETDDLARDQDAAL